MTNGSTSAATPTACLKSASAALSVQAVSTSRDGGFYLRSREFDLDAV